MGRSAATGRFRRMHSSPSNRQRRAGVRDNLELETLNALDGPRSRSSGQCGCCCTEQAFTPAHAGASGANQVSSLPLSRPNRRACAAGNILPCCCAGWLISRWHRRARLVQKIVEIGRRTFGRHEWSLVAHRKPRRCNNLSTECKNFVRQPFMFHYRRFCSAAG
jgi:hypothetical protein